MSSNSQIFCVKSCAKGWIEQSSRTEDGSNTLYIPDLNEPYHSIHGAIQESIHVFIKAGIVHYGQKNIRILEAGFGTGLNAFLTLMEARENQRNVVFHTFEKYPLTPDEVEQLNYPDHFAPENASLFARLHNAPWNEDVVVTPYFTLHKHKADFEEVNFQEYFDIVFLTLCPRRTAPFVDGRYVRQVLQSIKTGRNSYNLLCERNREKSPPQSRI